MARPRFRGRTRVYCASAGSSEAPDHIFARGFFPVDERDYLPQVPSCRSCNQEKAALEHYLLSVLPWGGESPASAKMLTEFLPRRLAKNRKLHRELSEGSSEVLVKRGDETLSSLALPLDSERLVALFQFITRGLVAHHWNLVVPTSHVARAGMFTSSGERFMKRLFVQRSAAQAQGKLGKGTILYEGVQAVDDPCLTIWRYRLYGGMMLGGDPNTSEVASDIWATTSSETAPNLFDLDR